MEKPSKITKSPFGFPISLKELLTLNLTEEKKDKRPEKEEKDDQDGETEKDKADINSREEKRYLGFPLSPLIFLLILFQGMSALCV